MQVTLQRSTDLYICSDAIRECHDTKDKSDTLYGCRECGSTDHNEEGCADCGADLNTDSSVKLYAGDKDKALIERVGNKHKHGSTLEHLVYTFAISGISRAVLQELARHRIASLTVKSTRYTLKELAKEKPFAIDSIMEGDNGYDRGSNYLVYTSSVDVNMASLFALENLRQVIKENISNDLAKYCMPESYKTSLTWTINARSLQNFINLRSRGSALWEIRQLADKLFEALPKDHKYLFENFNFVERAEDEFFAE